MGGELDEEGEPIMETCVLLWGTEEIGGRRYLLQKWLAKQALVDGPQLVVS